MSLKLIADIVVRNRHRKDMGDIEALADSITAVGLLHPIVVTPKDRLIAGQRRLAACKSLGWTKVPVTTVDIAEIARGEAAENFARKDFTPSEAVAIKREVEPEIKAEAKERRVSGGKLKAGAKLAPADRSKARDKVSAFTGMKRTSLAKAEAVVAAAEKEPKRFGHLVEEMDRTGKVNTAYSKIKRIEDEKRILTAKPVQGKFRTLMLDPPWDYDGVSLAGRGEAPYATMTLDDIADLPVDKWADDGCHLYLWATNSYILRAGELIKKWGFDFKTVITWVKPKFGMGSYFRSSTEHILFATRGTRRTRVANIATHFEAPLGAHSEKPEKFFEIVRAASYPPYGEVFQRKARDGITNLFKGV